MKKLLLIMLTFMASFSVYAQEVNTNTTLNEETIEPRGTFITRFVIDMRHITYPYNIVFGIPSNAGNVLGVSGPSDVRIPNWSIDEYNMMTIYLTEDDLIGLTPNNTRYIEVATTNGGYFVEIIGIF